MTPSSRPVVRRFAGFLTALATLAGLGALAPATALADVGMPTFAISGTVTDDSGAPAEGVSVQVSGPSFTSPVATDAAGAYAVPGLVPGSYTVTFVPPAGSPLLGESYDDAVSWNPTRIMVSTADVTGIDASLDHAATLTGRVVDADGSPIPGVGVQLQSVAFVYASATTGADGSFTATGLRPGDWRVSFTAPNGSPWVSELYDDAQTPESQTVVPVAAGATVTLNDAVLARGGTITGRILAPDGTPRPGIEVYASTGSGGGGSTTGPDGTYAISGLPDGDYTVNAASDWGANLVGVVYPGTTRWEDTEPVHVADAATVALHDMTLVAGATLAGVVYGPDGAPLARALVKAVSDQDQNGATTADDGSYSINLLSPGSYRVVASSYASASIVPTYYAATPGVTRPSQATPVVLEAGETAAGLDILAGARGSAPVTLVATAAHPPVLGEPFTIDVTLTGGAGTPTGSVWVGNTLVRDIDYADADIDASGHATLTYDAIDQGTYPWVDVYYGGDATYAGAAAMVDYVLGAAPPAVASLAPASGSVQGGGQVAITGTGFGPDTSVTFGGITATVAVQGPTSLVATAPAHAAGPVDVVVTTQGQASAPATYTYEKVPTSMALTGPPASTVAGAAAAFTATVTPAPTGSVSFVVDGGPPVVAPLVGGTARLSTTTLAAGPHTVVATFAGDATYGTSSARVTHTVTAPPAAPLPVVQHASPDVGLSTGGTLTVLTGKNFVKGRTTVSFGSVTTTKVTVLSSTKLLVVVPRHGASVVRVTATTPAGRSTTWARFTFVAPPAWHPSAAPFGPVPSAFDSIASRW
ncbi:MAG: carboxypeptidase regulatory-like domain-containing protein [Cellulomonas sp.]